MTKIRKILIANFMSIPVTNRICHMITPHDTFFYIYYISLFIVVMELQ